MIKHASLAAALLGLVTALPAHAASVTLSGSTVNYTFDNSLLGLFGMPSVSGNELYFTPNNFAAQSSNGGGYTLTQSTINVQVSLKPGYTFSKVGLHESGDYLLLGAGSSADVAGQLRIFNTGNPGGMHYVHSITPLAPLNLTGLPTRDWKAKAGFNMAALPGISNTSTINLTVENLLLANTVALPSSLAFVQKKFVGLDVITTPVPEPHAWLLTLVGLGLVGLQLRRSKGAVRQPGNA